MKKIMMLLAFMMILVGCQLPVQPPVSGNPKQLDTPIIRVDENGMASFAVFYADTYQYVLNDGEEVTTNESSLQLNEGDTLKVKAIGSTSKNTLDSEWSEVFTYTLNDSITEDNPTDGEELGDVGIEFPWI